jgi:excisionase family DNA binding protein
MTKQLTNPDPWLSVDEAAAWVALSHWTLRRAIKSGELLASKAGGRVLRIRLSDLEKWMSR